MHAIASSGKRTTIAGFVFGILAVVLAPEVAEAHFVLQEPAAWMSQTSTGLPEKNGPCGDEYDGTDAATPTGIVTAEQAGQTITVTIQEAIFHPGHYRIALATDRSALPPDPPVTAGSTPCGSTVIQSPPVFPVLADGVFVHTQPFTTPQTIQVTLPSNVTCNHCTLQVIEFMGNHSLEVPNGCFYHHCADFSISAGPVSGDAASVADVVVSGSGAPDGSGATGGSTATSSASTGGAVGTGGAGATAGGVASGGVGTTGGTSATGGGGSAPSSSGCGMVTGPAGIAATGAFGLTGALLLVRRRRARGKSRE